MKIDKESDEPVVFVTDVAIMGSLEIVKGKLETPNNMIFYETCDVLSNWQGDLRVVSNWKLQRDLVIEGNLYVDAPIYLNGKNLTVLGNVEVVSRLYFTGGKLTVNGDLLTKGSSAKLYMDSDADHLIVNGDAIFQGNGSFSYFNNGTAEFRGNFYQLQYELNSDNIYRSGYQAHYSHTTIFNGPGRQTISFQNPSTSSGSRFAHLKIDKESDEPVVFVTDVAIMGSLEIVKGKLETPNNMIFYETCDVLSNWQGDLRVVSNWKLQRDLVIEGNLYVDAPIYLNGKNLTVLGNVEVVSRLYFTGGKLTVNGDLLTKGSSAKLYMDSDADHLIVNGDAIFQGNGSSSYFDHGTAEFRGNFYQLQYELDSDNIYRSGYPAYGAHTTIFNGPGRQVISFQNPSTDYSRFAHLKIDKSSDEPVVFVTDVAIWGSLEIVKGKLETPNNMIFHETCDVLSNWQGDLRVVSNWKLQRDLFVEGNLYVDAPIYLNGKNLTVLGNVEVVSRLYFTGGKLTVNGDLLTKGSSAKLYMDSDADHLIVNGDAIFQGNGSSSYFDHGTAEFRGNFYQLQYELDSDNIYRSGYPAYGAHTTIFNGPGRQVISFQNPSTDYSRFAHLKIDKNNTYEVILESDIYVVGDVTIQNGTLNLNCFSMNVSGSTSVVSGEIIDGATWYKDADNDGYSDGTTITTCARPDGHKLASELTATNGDCDDGDTSVTTGPTWYKDADNDGYSDGATKVQCTRPDGYKLASELTAISGDCDDTNAVLSPATVWYKDVDEDGYSDGVTQTQCARPEGYKLASELTATSGDIDDNDASVNTEPEIAVSVGEVEIPTGGSYGFGGVDKGGEQSVTFSISNPGTAALSLSGSPRVAISGTNASDFTVITEPASNVLPGGTSAMVIRFAPQATGPRSAQVSIAISNDADESPYTFALTGTGLVAEDAVAPYPAPGLLNPVVGSLKTSSGTIHKFYITRVSGPGPLDAKVTIAQPGGETVETDSQDFWWLTGIRYKYVSEGAPADGSYTFTVSDTAGRSADKTVSFTYDDTVPVPGLTEPVANAHIEGTTPTLSIASLPEGTVADFRVYTYDDTNTLVWRSGGVGTTSVTVPAPYLQANTPYTWRAFIIKPGGEGGYNIAVSDPRHFYTGPRRSRLSSTRRASPPSATAAACTAWPWPAWRGWLPGTSRASRWR